MDALDYDQLEEKRQIALKSRWKDVIDALEETDHSWPDAERLYELDERNYGQKRFSMAANALVDTGHLEVFNPGVKQQNYRFKAFGYEEGYWDETRNRIRKMLRDHGEEQHI